jgi:hypothetical protein
MGCFMYLRDDLETIRHLDGKKRGVPEGLDI